MMDRGVEGDTNYCEVKRMRALFSFGLSELVVHSILACTQWAQGTSLLQRI